MSGTQPRVSIGIPVYNGERYLAEALESLLAQTFKDFEIIISDNCSTDQTEEICRRYAEQDSRVRYVRAETNRGAAWNHNRTVELAKGEYFKWQTYDDLCAPTFLEKCVAVLDQHPEVVLCYPQFVRVDAERNPLEARRSQVDGAAAPPERFRTLILKRSTCEEIYGVVRTHVLRQTRLIGSYSNSDDNLLAELALRGQFFEVPEPLFFHRVHSGQSTTVFGDRLARFRWFDTSAAGRLHFPFCRQFREYIGLIQRAPLSRHDKLRCLQHLAIWFWQKRRRIIEDLYLVFFRHTLMPSIKRYAPWTRPIWLSVKKTLKKGIAVSV
ncbi:glycosyltransferase family 2 protein [Methylocaldum sp.]|uniref:glycosyltransferase family 2 protein n=1 Tax=Methylocaldum sp. TaxID=1969727 RepID=UPI002D632BE3|nr:glycosyltransferase family 2 protein [Methylocaldum sp.]HYE34809.1 glycosyltransferase family 2 protein [Methylocaldum sp.]